MPGLKKKLVLLEIHMKHLLNEMIIVQEKNIKLTFNRDE